MEKILTVSKSPFYVINKYIYIYSSHLIESEEHILLEEATRSLGGREGGGGWQANEGREIEGEREGGTRQRFSSNEYLVGVLLES